MGAGRSGKKARTSHQPKESRKKRTDGVQAARKHWSQADKTNTSFHSCCGKDHCIAAAIISPDANRLPENVPGHQQHQDDRRDLLEQPQQQQQQQPQQQTQQHNG